MNYLKPKIILFMTLAALIFSQGISYSKGIYVCDEKIVHIGQTMDNVRAALGEPLRIEENDQPADQNEAQDQNESNVIISKWIYKCESRIYRFIFKNEILNYIYQLENYPE
jgi:hypothetical protein